MSVLRGLWLYGPVLGYCLFIFTLSNQPSLPATPGGDLVAHFAAYTLMGGLFFRAIAFSSNWTRTKVFLWAAIAGTLYGLSDEFHQSFIPGRFATLEDCVADALGSVFGAICGLIVYRRAQDGAWRFLFGR